jgi:hypothetical protein
MNVAGAPLRVRMLLEAVRRKVSQNGSAGGCRYESGIGVRAHQPDISLDVAQAHLYGVFLATEM